MTSVNHEIQLKVLLVEDSRLMRQMAAQQLISVGYEVLEAGTIKEGMDLFRTSQPDILILDQNLPDGKGLDFVVQIRSVSAELPIIMFSSIDDAWLRIQALTLGANDFVTKPVEFRELVARVDVQIAVSQRSSSDSKCKNEPEGVHQWDIATQLPNESMIEDIVCDHWLDAMINDTPLSVMAISLQNLDEVVDKFGSQIGDLALRQVARMAAAVTRIQDSLFRLPGDLILVALPEADTAQCEEIGKRVVDQITSSVQRLGSGLEHKLSVNVGISELHQDNCSTLQELVAKATGRLELSNIIKELPLLGQESQTIDFDYFPAKRAFSFDALSA